MLKNFQVNDFGVYHAANAQGARDACAADAGYKNEADMVAQLERPSELVATEVFAVGVRFYPMDVIRNLMDDEICEYMHNAVEREQEFVNAYVREHMAKFGEEFVVN